MDISKYRKDFPILNVEDGPTYLDSACMTLRPQVVIDAINEYYTKYPACGGRSVHKLGWQVPGWGKTPCEFYYYKGEELMVIFEGVHGKASKHVEGNTIGSF